MDDDYKHSYEELGMTAPPLDPVFEEQTQAISPDQITLQGKDDPENASFWDVQTSEPNHPTDVVLGVNTDKPSANSRNKRIRITQRK